MRLTERKTIYPSCDKQGNLTKVNCIEIKNKGLAEEKLCQLEDIEDELGIDLVVLLKALILNEEIFCKDFKGNIICTENEISLNEDSDDGLCLHIIHIGYFYIKDYGKTWALTKEELL